MVRAKGRSGFFEERSSLTRSCVMAPGPGAFMTNSLLYVQLTTLSQRIEFRLSETNIQTFRCCEFTPAISRKPRKKTGVRLKPPPFWRKPSSVPWHCCMRSNPSAARCYKQPPTNSYPAAIGACHKT